MSPYMMTCGWAFWNNFLSSMTGQVMTVDRLNQGQVAFYPEHGGYLPSRRTYPIYTTLTAICIMISQAELSRATFSTNSTLSFLVNSPFSPRAMHQPPTTNTPLYIPRPLILLLKLILVQTENIALTPSQILKNEAASDFPVVNTFAAQAFVSQISWSVEYHRIREMSYSSYRNRSCRIALPGRLDR